MFLSSLKVSQLLPIIPLALLVAVGSFSFLSQRHHQALVPATSDWEDASEHVRKNFKEGDIIRVEPYWADQARIYLSELPIDLLSYPEEEALYQYNRLWIIVGFGKDEEVLEKLPQGYKLEEEFPFGKTTLFLVTIPDSDYVKFDILEHVKEAKVKRIFANRDQKCTTWSNKQWHCKPRSPWLWVGTTVMEPGDESHKCLYAAAIEENGLLEIRFPKVTLSELLEGHAGLDIGAIRSERGSDLQFKILIGDQLVHEKLYKKHEKGFLSYTVDTSNLAGQQKDIVYTVQAADLLDRFFCFTGRVNDVH